MMSGSTARILCVWLPYWATTRLRHARRSKAGQTSSDAPADEPLATVEAVRGVRRLVSVCPIAEAAGLQPGQALTQARAICPALVAADAEPVQDAAALAALAQWANRYTPLAAPCAPDALWLDIAGCAHLWGGEAALAADLVGRFHRWGLGAHWAIADSFGAAWALAHHAPAIIATGAESTALAALPIACLRLEPDTISGLRRLGLTTVTALARLPRADLAARFGMLPRLRLDQALGIVAENISWLRPAADWLEEQRFVEPILTTEDCTRALAMLAQRLCDRLRAKRLGGRQFVADFQRLDGSLHSLAVATALPVHDPRYLLRLLAEKLDGLDPGYGIDVVMLSAPAIEQTSLAQQDFAGTAQKDARLARLVDALANRLRPGRLWRMAPRDSHVPERAMQPVAPLSGDARSPQWHNDAASPRPIRLLATPELIDVTAPLPDDPPIQFRWRGALHRVRAATGPERISDEWWRKPAGATRDYYHVEDEQGGRYWMFRESTQWFLHGLFG